MTLAQKATRIAKPAKTTRQQKELKLGLKSYIKYQQQRRIFSEANP